MIRRDPRHPDDGTTGQVFVALCSAVVRNLWLLPVFINNSLGGGDEAAFAAGSVVGSSGLALATSLCVLHICCVCCVREAAAAASLLKSVCLGYRRPTPRFSSSFLQRPTFWLLIGRPACLLRAAASESVERAHQKKVL